MIENYLLEQFVAVAKYGTLLKASEELHISQPSLPLYAKDRRGIRCYAISKGKQ